MKPSSMRRSPPSSRSKGVNIWCDDASRVSSSGYSCYPSKTDMEGGHDREIRRHFVKKSCPTRRNWLASRQGDQLDSGVSSPDRDADSLYERLSTGQGWWVLHKTPSRRDRIPFWCLEVKTSMYRLRLCDPVWCPRRWLPRIKADSCTRPCGMPRVPSGAPVHSGHAWQKPQYSLDAYGGFHAQSIVIFKVDLDPWLFHPRTERQWLRKIV